MTPMRGKHLGDFCDLVTVLDEPIEEKEPPKKRCRLCGSPVARMHKGDLCYACEGPVKMGRGTGRPSAGCKPSKAK